jgi:ribonuclease HII
MLPFLGIGALAGSIMTSVILGKYNKQKGVDVHIRPEDLKASLQERTKELQEMISRKQELIHQTEAEIEEITKQIKQYNNFIENEALLADETKETTINMGG